MDDLNNNIVAELMEKTISQQPVMVGMRIAPEETLSNRLGLSRYQLRKATDILVDKGILRRKRGSGTFIVALPKHSATMDDNNHTTEERNVVAESHDENNIDPKRSHVKQDMLSKMQKAMEQNMVELHSNSSEMHSNMPISTRKLHIGLWGDLHCLGTTHQRVIAGMSQRFGELGHILSVYSTVIKPNLPLPLDVLSERIRTNPNDGVIVAEEWSSLFQQAMDKIHVAVPSVFLCSTARVHKLWPVVSQDFDRAMVQALQSLYAQGHRRLAILAPLIEHYPMEGLTQLYDNIRKDLGLDYRRIETCELGVISAMRAAKRLFKEDCPDAVYITDDFLVEGVAEAFVSHNKIPGQDNGIGVITLSNAGQTLPENINWSRVEFDPIVLGELTADTLIRLIDAGPEHVSSIELLPRWIPGETHLNGRSQQC